MCGRFAQAVPLGKLKKISLFNDFNQTINESYNITPGENACIILYRLKAEQEISRWGFPGQTVKKGAAPKPIINARSESVAEKFTFRKSFRECRCIIPVTGFYEWKKNDQGKEPFFIYPEVSGNDDSGILFLAGLYMVAADDQLRFTIITRESAGSLKEIHDRMPVCIKQENLEHWLNPQTMTNELLHLINSGYLSEFRLHPVSSAVNNPSNKTKECITPVIDQHQQF